MKRCETTFGNCFQPLSQAPPITAVRCVPKRWLKPALASPVRVHLRAMLFLFAVVPFPAVLFDDIFDPYSYGLMLAQAAPKEAFGFRLAINRHLPMFLYHLP